MAAKRQYDIPSSGYNRRLRSILLNEDYGPKLARLSAGDQQRVLQLINQNKGREARTLITDLDAVRRHRRATTRRARQYAALNTVNRTVFWEDYRDQAEAAGDSAEFWALYATLPKAL